MFIDSHCHLNYTDPNDIDALINRAKQHHVDGCLSVCTKLADMPAILSLVCERHNIWASVGVHPNEAINENLSTVKNDLEIFLKNPKVIALGETGLDYYYQHSPKDIQKENFLIHLDLAQTHNIPVIVHTRDAEEDTVEILKQFPKVKGVLHCFSGSKTLAEEALKLGFYLSFSGIITFKNAQALRDIVANVDMDKILIETDSPYLAPHPHRGKPNEPAYVHLVAQQIAHIKNIPLELVGKQTTHNFFNLFGIRAKSL